MNWEYRLYERFAIIPGPAMLTFFPTFLLIGMRPIANER